MRMVIIKKGDIVIVSKSVGGCTKRFLPLAPPNESQEAFTYPLSFTLPLDKVLNSLGDWPWLLDTGGMAGFWHDFEYRAGDLAMNAIRFFRNGCDIFFPANDEDRAFDPFDFL